MKLKKVLIVMLLPVLAEVAMACCDCIDSVIKNYSHQHISVFNLDNSGESPVISLSSTIPKTAYGIQVDLVRELVAVNQIRPGFFQSAYATSCNCPPELYIKAKDSVISLEIFTVHDFDATHEAGSDVSEYFRMLRSNELISLEEYLEMMNEGTDGRGNSRWGLYVESDLRAQVNLLLMNAPTFESNHQFNVQLTLSDNRTLNQLTTEVNLY